MGLWFSAICLISSWVLGMAGLLLGIFLEPEYFARMGAVVVLMSVMSEYALIKAELGSLYKSLRGQGAAECGNTGILDLAPSLWHQRLALMSHITIIIGTVIWGFGDLWLK